MLTQATLNFESYSPINIDRLKGQNKRLFDFLSAGNRINCFSEAMRTLRIGYLNSRISDLINKNNVPIKKERKKVADIEGNLVDVVEYFL